MVAATRGRLDLPFSCSLLPSLPRATLHVHYSRAVTYPLSLLYFLSRLPSISHIDSILVGSMTNTACISADSRRIVSATTWTVTSTTADANSQHFRQRLAPTRNQQLINRARNDRGDATPSGGQNGTIITYTVTDPIPIPRRLAGNLDSVNVLSPDQTNDRHARRGASSRPLPGA